MNFTWTTNDSRYRLASAIYTRDADRILRFIEASSARLVHVNAPTVSGEPFQPYAGIRASEPGGGGALEFFSEDKVVAGVDARDVLHADQAMSPSPRSRPPRP